MEKYKIKFVKSILDNVHGFIGLTEVESAIERLPIFKRLQNISQLGLTNRIFPCALHNRYTHSLGVMHIVDQMAIQLGFDDDERQLVRLAGMLHDIGHYPFSHDVEAAYMSVYKTEGVIPTSSDSIEEFLLYAQTAKENIERIASPPKELKPIYHREKSAYHHENVGAVVIQHSSEIQKTIAEFYVQHSSKYASENSDSVVEEIIADIASIITGDCTRPSKHFTDKFEIMVQIMHSELDADRIDYLLRDSTFSGASYGNFDLGMLIRELDCMQDPNSGKWIVGITPNGIGCAEQFLLNRYFAYSQIIYNKSTSFLGQALQSIVKWLLKEINSGFSYKAILPIAKEHEKNPKFIQFTDAYLINCINDIYQKRSCPEQIYRLVHFIQEYKVPDTKDEVVCSGIKPKYVAQKMKRSNLYKNLSKYASSKAASDTIYLYGEVCLTDSLPQKQFDELLHTTPVLSSVNGNQTGSDEDEDEKANSTYQLDRLLNGLVIVDKNSNAGPTMLVDSDRSMLRDIYNLRYCVLRRYSIPKL